MSDLHLEFQWATPPRGSAPGYDVFVPPVTAENLALLGDIGIIAHSDSLFHFLEQQLTRFKRVFYLAGNHEYYGTTYEEAQVKFRQFAERVQQRRQNEPELGEFVLLHRTRYDFPGTNVTVLGCTLWSDIPIEDAGMVRAGLNDFQCIAGWTTDEHTRIHREEVAWLTTEMEQLQREAPSRKVAILTHHAPTFQRTSDPKFKDSPINAGFATELTGCKQLWNPNLLKVWAFGHTHWLCDHDVHGVRLYANQRGYEGAEARQLCFNPSAVVFI
ncbi:Ser/Thr protein phosphatase superfamily protein [Auriculariales sp. MPI-PUGE-AT-0066]|nr:Ser/Thr protein phosphatase superfamily protein [Auriculariales sp. MPI-PUGE-AT-0066]